MLAIGQTMSANVNNQNFFWTFMII